MPSRDVTVSIVSHGQNGLVNQLLEDIRRQCSSRVAVILTENIPDAPNFALGELAAQAHIIRNDAPKGFGANHNAAFAHCRTPYFCVANPDIRLAGDPLPSLVDDLSDRHVGVAGPLVRNSAGAIEDSARRFPTPASLIRKFFFRPRGPDYRYDRGPIEVDWIAGMFMLFRAETYRAIAGFDERYFLYYEDVDICRRLKGRGMKIIFEPRSSVIHNAQRASRKSARMALHHLTSMARFLGSKREDEALRR